MREDDPISDAETDPGAQSETDGLPALLAAIPDPGRRADCERLLGLIREVTGEEPEMWGGSIIGFGRRHYRYASGREGDTMKIGLSPRKQNLTLYGVIFYEHNTELLGQLGPHTTGKGCLYIKRLADVDLGVLRRMIKAAYDSHAQDA